MTAPTKTCRDCGAEFKRSPADTTVRCPDCRDSARRKAATSTIETRAHDRMIELKLVAYAARREHGYHSPEAEAAVADYTDARVYYERVRDEAVR